MQRLDFQVAEESDWKFTNSSEKQIKPTGSHDCTSLQKHSRQELKTPQLQPTAAVAVANVVKPQAPQQQPTAAVAVDNEVEPQEVAAAQRKELLCTENANCEGTGTQPIKDER